MKETNFCNSSQKKNHPIDYKRQRNINECPVENYGSVIGSKSC